MNLRPKMLLVFAGTVIGVMSILYFLSRAMLLSSFQQLEDEQMKQNVAYARTDLNQELRGLARTTDDYAYWDRVYNFLADPQSERDIGSEFQNAAMDGLGLNLVVLLDMQGRIVYAKAYDTTKHKETSVPIDFLEEFFRRPGAPAGGHCAKTVRWPGLFSGCCLFGRRPAGSGFSTRR